MKTKILSIALIFSFCLIFSQPKVGIKVQKADESGIIKVDKAPQLIVTPKPVYPYEAKLQNIQGKVYLKILVDEKGNVAKVKIEKGGNSLLDKSALTAIKKAKFSPALVKDAPVKVWVVLPITFKLDLENEKVPSKVNVGRNSGTNEYFLVEQLPKMISSTTPTYPEKAKENKIEGKIFVKVLVDTTGTPKNAVVIRSNAGIFDQPSIDAAMNSRFSPVMNKGKKVSFWIIMPYKYTLNNKNK